MRYAQDRCRVDDPDSLLLELQSVAIEYLLTEYKLGERAWPLHYLFAWPKGVMTGWMLKYIEKRNSEQRGINVGLTPDVDFELVIDELNASVTSGHVRSAPSRPAGVIEDPPEVDYAAAMRHVEDGVTLTSREYRVLRFCLRHAGDAHGRSLVKGLHIFLSKQLAWGRSKVSRVFRLAAAKIVEVTGETERVLGLSESPTDQRNRRNRLLGLGHQALTDDEADALIDLAGRIGDAAACRAFGVHSKTIYLLRRRNDQKNKSAAYRSGYGLDGISA